MMTIKNDCISVYGDSAGWYAEYFDGGRLYLVDSETEFLTIYRAAADGRTEYGAGDMIADYAPDEISDELTDIYKALRAGIAPYLTERRIEMTKYYKDSCSGATASITEHRDGTATLKTNVGGKKKSRVYANRKSAYNAWNRMCN